MKRNSIFWLGITAAASVVSTVNAAIMDSEAREQKLAAIHALVSDEVDPIDSDLLMRAKSPFEPDLGNEVQVEDIEPRRRLSDAELLTALSDYINPTGIFMFGGEFYLIFKEKKLKVGSELGIKFNDAEYGVTIADITGSTYTIRRGEAELQLKLK